MQVAYNGKIITDQQLKIDKIYDLLKEKIDVFENFWDKYEET
jgi:hypothetical protein